MAKKKYLDLNGALYFKNKIKGYVDGIAAKKVDAVPGKGLSTNDLTDELKQKILDAGSSSFDGQYGSLIGKPKINNVELKGENSLTELGIQPAGNYALKTEIPTVPTKLSEFTNDSNFQTDTQVQQAIAGKADTADVDGKLKLKADKTEVTALDTKTTKALEGKADKTHTHTKDQIADMPTKLSQFTNDSKYQTDAQVAASIAEAVGKITSFETQVVDGELPLTGKKGVIYFKSSSKSGVNQAYDEYIWVNDKWEFIGTTAVDLTGYVQDTDLEAISNAEIDGMFSA